MSERYCPQCGTDVEDAGGFCLLGHSLKVAAVTDPVKELRSEVERVFEKARAQVESVIAEATGEIPAVPAPPPLPDDLEEQTETNLARLWEGFESELNAPADPIAAFAPAPRMDWGPEKAKRFKRDGSGRVRPFPA